MHASARYCTLPRTILICLLRNIVERHKTLKGRVVYKLHPVSHIQMCAYEERCSLWEGRRHWDEVIARSRHRREKSFDVSRNLGKARTFNAHGRKGGSFHFNDLSPAHCRANDGGSIAVIYKLLRTREHSAVCRTLAASCTFILEAGREDRDKSRGPKLFDDSALLYDGANVC